MGSWLGQAGLGEPNHVPGIRSPGGKIASARRVVLYRGAALILIVMGMFVGAPWDGRMIAAGLVCLVLAELATLARAVEETAMQGERAEAKLDE